MVPFFRALSTLLLLAQVGVPARADIVDTPTERHLSLKSATVHLSIPRRDWVITREQRNPDGSNVYYALSSDQLKTLLSVYIDKPTACHSAAGCRDLVMRNPAFKDAKDLQTLDVGKFSVSQFYLDKPQGLALVQTNLVASAYVDGYWFNLHISKVGNERPDPASLVELLKEFTIE
jgi:hypothetical protein